MQPVTAKVLANVSRSSTWNDSQEGIPKYPWPGTRNATLIREIVVVTRTFPDLVKDKYSYVEDAQ
jgi:hypothetical protein